MQKITPFLWFDGKAEEAMNFCVSELMKNDMAGVKENCGPPFNAMNSCPSS